MHKILPLLVIVCLSSSTLAPGFCVLHRAVLRLSDLFDFDIKGYHRNQHTDSGTSMTKLFQEAEVPSCLPLSLTNPSPIQTGKGLGLLAVYTVKGQAMRL